MIIIHNHGGFYCDKNHKNHTVLAFVLALPWLNVLKTRPCFSVKWSISLFGNKLLGSSFPFGFFITDSWVSSGMTSRFVLVVYSLWGKQNAVFPLYTCVCFPSVSLCLRVWLWGFECSQRHAQQVFPWPSYISLPSVFNPAQNPLLTCADPFNFLLCFPVSSTDSWIHHLHIRNHCD